MTRNDNKRNPLFNYARYSSLAFQMVFIILGGIWLGRRLDQWLVLHFPVFTLLFSLLSIAAAIYHSIKDFIKSDKK
ncbi:MAG: AtpZ/AtpI family protein [Bacteroidales bacterium]|jgi:hypothetical protein|nr:AtpZ/AtpI family protein [Bacteroidales bacterium]NPV35212.1 AtpZ/AtpI family protein [Bacteroidales bacterium]